ncbi:MAG: VOC family protein [Chloroflexi bacterium]|nr:VOC family protein [Chloroflexota bacterium]
MSNRSDSAAESSRINIGRIDHVALVVRDLQTSKKWYGEMFGFESLESSPNSPYVGNAGVKLALLQIAEGSTFAPPVSQGARACHFAFGADRSTFDSYRARLDDLNMRYEELTHSDSESIYFSDPDGYMIEVTTYETG